MSYSDAPPGFSTPQFSDAPSGFAPEQSWSDTFKEAGRNLPSDFLNTSLGLGAFAANPGAMAGSAAYQLATNPQARSEAVRNITNYFSIPGLKENISQHPVGTAVDVATLFTPVKGAGVVEKAASVPLKILSVPELKAGGGAALNTARDSGVYFTKEFVDPLRKAFFDTARQMNFRPGRRGSGEVTEVLKDVSKMDRPWSFGDIHTIQQDLNQAWKVAKRAGYDNYANVANKLHGVLDTFVGKIKDANGEGMFHTEDLDPAKVAHMYNEGMSIYHQAKIAQTLERASKLAEIDAKQFAVSGEANTLRREARRLLRDDAKGKPTGLRPQDIQVLNDFNKGSLSEWLLKKARSRVLSGFLGHAIGGVAGPIGQAAGTVAGIGLAELAAKKADAIAVQRFTKFISDVRAGASQQLGDLLGNAMHSHLMGSPRGQRAVSNWVNKVGTKGWLQASKPLAIVIGQEVKRPDLIPLIESRINNLAQQIQGTDESQAQPEQQQ